MKLETAGQTLDYRKYAEPLLELILLGRLIAPGGEFVRDDAPVCPINLLGLLPNSNSEAQEDEEEEEEPLSLEVQAKRVEVLGLLIRRYRYLQRILEENSLKQILQYIHKYSPAQRSNLATATALMISTDLVSPIVLQSITKEHLTKTGSWSLQVSLHEQTR